MPWCDEAYGHREQERRIKDEQRKKEKEDRENRAQRDSDSHSPR